MRIIGARYNLAIQRRCLDGKDAVREKGSRQSDVCSFAVPAAPTLDRPPEPQSSLRAHGRLWVGLFQGSSFDPVEGAAVAGQLERGKRTGCVVTGLSPCNPWA